MIQYEAEYYLEKDVLAFQKKHAPHYQDELMGAALDMGATRKRFNSLDAAMTFAKRIVRKTMHQLVQIRAGENVKYTDDGSYYRWEYDESFQMIDVEPEPLSSPKQS